MSVLIKGLKMPTNCKSCRFHGFGGIRDELNVCMFTGQSQLTLSPDRMSECPLIEIPPHGDLIDRDALAKCLGITDMDCYKCAWGNHGFCGRGGDFNDACEAIEEAPTVIEAEEDSNG